ncbi:MAG: hydrogenase expression/formation protein [bacterium]|nr:hydrogenase expression/formation protein [bacterium]
MNCTKEFTHNAPFVHVLMHEITVLLGDLALNGKEGAIDLRGLPLLDQDKKQLEDLLGRGEVSAIVNIMGETQIWETAYSGVWWLRHKDTGDKVISDQVAVTIIPEILKTHKSDVKSSLERLRTVFKTEEKREDGNSHDHEQLR